MFNNISLEQARQILKDNSHILTGEMTLLVKGRDRILGQAVYAPHDLPCQDQSAVDGYALGEGMETIGSSYHLSAELSLESFPRFSLGHGQAAAVPTGGILPAGTKAVVPAEKTRMEKQQVIVLEQIKSGNNIKRVGEDFKQGDLILPSQTQLDFGAIALLSAYGIQQVETIRKPKAAIVCLAGNIISPETELQDGWTHDSNGPMLETLIDRDGGEVSSLIYMSMTGPEAMISSLQNQIEQLDLIIFTGGTYEQDANNIEAIMHALGAQMLYQGVQIQPGSHSGAACFNKCLLLSLSGNPAACAVNYHLFVKPVIQRLLGQKGEDQTIEACCVNGFGKKSNSRRLIRGRAWWTNSGWKVEVLPGQKPSMIRSLLYCNALIDLPAGSSLIEAGQEVTVRLMYDSIFFKG